MQIRGVELDFRLYDEDKADVKNRYFEELKKMGESKKKCRPVLRQKKTDISAAGLRVCLTMYSVKVPGKRYVETEMICSCTWMLMGSLSRSRFDKMKFMKE